MLIKKLLTAGAASAVLAGAVVPAMASADGLERNQTALAVAGKAKPCTPKEAATPALRKQCALRSGGNALQDDAAAAAGTDAAAAGGGASTGAIVAGGLGLGAVGLGIAAGVSNDDDADTISS